MVYPIMGKTISSYHKLMNDPATAEVWQTAFKKVISGMAQEDNKMGQKGTNAMFLMTHKKLPMLTVKRSFSLLLTRSLITVPKRMIQTISVLLQLEI
jgi:hypothetical protein